MTFLYNITILDDPSFPKLAPTPYPTPNPHSRTHSRRSSVASVYSINSVYAQPSEDRQRHVLEVYLFMMVLKVQVLNLGELYVGFN